MIADPGIDRQRIRWLLRALYREELRAGAYRVYRRRAGSGPVGTMLGTFLKVEARMIAAVEGHLMVLGVGQPGRRGLLRHAMAGLGAALAGLTGLGGPRAILRRVRAEEWRGAERYAREVEWVGWSAAERETLDGHRCDQLYQSHWAEEIERDLQEGAREQTPGDR